MIFFRVLLIFVFCVLSAYTLLVVSGHGLNLFSVFFGDMQKISWAGQFNLDFMFMLLFSAIWVMWRHHYSLSGIALGVVAFFWWRAVFVYLSAYSEFSGGGRCAHYVVGA